MCVCVCGRHLNQRFFSLVFCTCSSIVAFGFCCLSAHLRSICDIKTLGREFDFTDFLCVCVKEREICSANSIRIDLQRAFSSLIWRYTSYEDLKMEA